MKFAGMNFIRTKFSSLDGTTVVAFTHETTEERPFTMKASQRGIWFENNMPNKISSGQDLQAFAQAVSDLWCEHERLAPQLTKTLSGHE